VVCGALTLGVAGAFETLPINHDWERPHIARIRINAAEEAADK
jgi:hypothetical protein